MIYQARPMPMTAWFEIYDNEETEWKVRGFETRVLYTQEERNDLFSANVKLNDELRQLRENVPESFDHGELADAYQSLQEDFDKEIAKNKELTEQINQMREHSLKIMESETAKTRLVIKLREEIAQHKAALRAYGDDLDED